jgi:uncharacterized repeat protein (TIGR01451 family)
VPLSTDVSVNGPAVAGERLLYTLTVSNTSALPIENVQVSFVLPAELSFSNTTNADPDASDCGLEGCTPGEQATWSLDTLEAGETRTITVNPLVDGATLDGVVIDLPVVFSSNDTGDMQIVKSVEVFNTPSADLALGASNDPVAPNETFTYHLDMGNTSTESLTNTELRVFLPAGVTVAGISDGGSEVSAGEVVWSVNSLAVGESLHREITVTTDATLIDGEFLKASAQLTHDNGLAVDNTAEYAVTVEAETSVPLQIEIGSSANPVVANEWVTYTLSVSNLSALPVDGVSVLLRVPAELSFNDSMNADPDAGNCSSQGCTPAEEAVWALGTLAAGETRTINIQSFVNAGILSGNLISVPVRVSATGLEDRIDLLKTVAVYNTPPAEVALSTSKDPVVAYQGFTYYLDVGNTSGGSLTNTELRAYVPPGFTVNGISDGGTEVSAGEVVWTIGSLSTGTRVHREISMIANAASAGEIFMLSAKLLHDDGLEQDNESEFAVTVADSTSSASLLTTNIVATPNPVAANGSLTYTIRITNNFSLQVDDVNVLFRVPAELSFSNTADADPDADNCGSEGCTAREEAVWSLGSMASGDIQVITINTTVGAGVGNGNLIVAPFRITGAGVTDVISLQYITGVQD